MPRTPRRAAITWAVRIVAALVVAGAAFGAVLAYPRSHVAGSAVSGPDYPKGYGRDDPRSPRVAWGPDERTVLYTERIGPRCSVRSVRETSLAPNRIELDVRRDEHAPCTYPTRSDPYVLKVPTVWTRGKAIRVSLGYRVLVLHWPDGG